MTASKSSNGLAVSRKIKPRKRYLKYMEISPTYIHNSHDPLNCKTIAYESNVLKAIRHNCKHVEHAKVLPFGAIRKIRELRINHNQIKMQSQPQDRTIIQQTGHNSANLRYLLNTKTNSTANIIGATCNVQSLKAKELLVNDLIKDYSLDFLVATETWLSDKTDKQWYDNTEFNKNDLRLYNANRKNRKGGGLALIAKSNYQVSECDTGATKSFEFATWKLHVRGASMDITAIYHPLYSLRNKCTNSMFLDDFTDFTAKILPERTNNILMADFNLHISKDKEDSSDISTVIFMNACEAMGLYRHVTFPTHKAGNTLDLILSEISNSIRVSTINQGPFISDHRAVICTLMAKKE